MTDETTIDRLRAENDGLRELNSTLKLRCSEREAQKLRTICGTVVILAGAVGLVFSVPYIGWLILAGLLIIGG